MKKKTVTLAIEDGLFVDLTFHRLSPSLITEIADKIVRPYYVDSLNVAIHDLIRKALTEQDSVLSHTHIKSIESCLCARLFLNVG